MKNWLTPTLGFCLALLTFTSCEKEEDRVVAGVATTTPVLTTSATAPLELKKADAAKEVVSFTTTSVSYEYTGQVPMYVLEIDKKGNAFKSPKTFSLTPGKSFSLTVGALNSILVPMGERDANGQYKPVTLEARVKSMIGSAASVQSYTKVSAIKEIIATPYTADPSYLYVPGGYQNWNPASAPALVSPDSDGKYEGYVYFNDASEFKFTPKRSWEMDYGSDGSATGLQEKGGNLKLSEGGYYQFQVNLNAKTYTTLKTSWGVVGSATPGGWDTDTDLVYDDKSATLKTTLALTGGEIKFRANDGWGLNFGDDGADAILEQGGKNIGVAQAGTYEVTLDLSQGPGKYTYSLVKK